MSFADALTRKNASVFTRLGEAATWLPVTGDPVENIMVRRASPDETLRFGQSEAIVASALIRVQASDVANPAKGDGVQIFDSSQNLVATLKVIAKPTFADPHRMVWECPSALA